MKLNLFISFVTVFSINAFELPYYEAKYKFESDEINTGLLQNRDGDRCQ